MNNKQAELISPKINLADFETPLLSGAFEMDDQTKIELITNHFREILTILGLDLKDDSLKDSPKRIAKMYVNEFFSGLNPANKPDPTLFENSYQYQEMLVEKNIAVFSNCEHHFVPITGKAHVAYISNGKVIGLSKLNRIVQYYSRRPQVQERLTIQICEEIKKVLEHVAVMIDAYHHCVSARGIRDAGSSTITTAFSGKFKDTETKNEFLKYVG
ncbi:GTP cyclohydrolase I FolE [Nubsella zeaxanthinifaciens]|uniref:GTP cyclohydrolase I FolE n=1 Tax=Nubsella zeaxanthinifaciens TaxID=392412 RepID=UPI003D041ED9